MKNKIVLCIDIGTTWAKLAVLEKTKNDYNVLHNSKIKSNVEHLIGTKESIQKFIELCTELEDLIKILSDKLRIDYIGLTGIREGLVFIDKKGDPIWVSGNKLLEDTKFSEMNLKGGNSTEPINWFSKILKIIPEAHTFLSLQGFLFYKLTNKYAITKSELAALGINIKSIKKKEMLINKNLHIPSIIIVAKPIKSNTKISEALVFIAGTDEQAGFYGAGINHKNSIAISTGSYWSIAAEVINNSSFPEYIRFTPKVSPYSQTISIVGYKWGIYLEQISKGINPTISLNLPIWAKGDLLKYLQNANSIELDVAMNLISRDIEWALDQLSKKANLSKDYTITLYGGGVINNYLLVQDIMNKVGHPWKSLDLDASQLGCFYTIVGNS